MMKLEDIRGLLKDRRVSIIAEATGIHFNTIREIRDNENANPTYRVMTKLTDYLENNNGRPNEYIERTFFPSPRSSSFIARISIKR
jgi:hypothetical protein